MFRLSVRRGILRYPGFRLKSSKSIRSTFIEYFIQNGHKQVKSSSVVSLYDPTVPFVNAGMNQFKGVFLGKVKPPCARAVNSQKCVRAGGKHNDLDVVGTDGHHHTFFEMLGSWSFGDYYKKEACQMAWDLLLGPYRLKPEQLLVTYFEGDTAMGLTEDHDCRDIWKTIGVPDSKLKALSAKDNFWEMGASGPCGPCTEIHYINPDGTLTEIWNIVFINFIREDSGGVKALSHFNIDTGMGLERMVAIMQGVPSNYDTDLFQPIIKAIEKNSTGVLPYGGKYDSTATLDSTYRRLADHARMISVCLADGVFPASSLNLKQIMRKSLKISTEIFQNPQLLRILYDQVVETLGPTYPELISKESDAKLIIEHEEQAYTKMKSELTKKMKKLVRKYPEVEALGDVELASLPSGYKEFKQKISKQNSTVIPGELVFRMYGTYGFHEDLIQRIADLNNMKIDKVELEIFEQLLSKYKMRHKTAYKEQDNKTQLFADVIARLRNNGNTCTNDSHKYNYDVKDGKIEFKALKTKLVAILNKDLEWLDILETCENGPYYLVTKDTNFYCEEGGQIADNGVIYVKENVVFQVDIVFKIQDFVFHKGHFGGKSTFVKCDCIVEMLIDTEKRLKLMRNHTGVHLLNSAVRKVLPNSVVCPIGSSVNEKGISLNLSVYGDKVTQDKMLETQNLIRESIRSNVPVETRVVDSIELSTESSVTTIPGERYPEVGLRLVIVYPPLLSKELCCGTHVPSTGEIQDFCITCVKGAGSNTPTIFALTGGFAKEARELFCRVQKLEQVIKLVDPERRKEEVSQIKERLSELCGTTGAPYGEYKECLNLLDTFEKRTMNNDKMELHAIAVSEVSEAVREAVESGRRFAVHFLRCSYLMQSEGVKLVLASEHSVPTLVLGCAGGVIVAGASVPHGSLSDLFTAKRWLSCIVPVFEARVAPPEDGKSPLTYAEMTATKVSLINCEQLVQDAMRVAIKFAQSHIKEKSTEHTRTQEKQHR